MRDKVKRFISILMTALMLVNLLPVGALAEGMKLDSNSVQSRASKKSANVYVYVKVTGDKAGLTINQSGWYTIGKSENVPGMGTPYWFMHGSHSFSDVGVSYKTVLKTNFTRWTDNQKIDLDQITWTEFYVDNGADDYVKAGTYTWHMNGTIDIKQLPSVYTIKYVDYDTKELIHSYEESGLMGQTPKKITAPDSWQENLYSFYFVNGHPKEQTVDFKKDKGELTFYYKKNTANYTVNYYLNGTTTKVAAPKKGTAALGSSVTESPITVDGYTPVSGDSKKITIKANSDENVINFYYYKNVELTANSDMATYDGNEHSVSGFTGKTVKEEKTVTLSFDSVNVPEVTRKDAGTDTVAFNENPVGKVDTTEKYIVTKATDGQLVISKRPVTLTSASDKKVYDGNALTNDKVTVSGDGFVEGEGATYKVTGTQTNVGKSKNTFTYELNGNTKAINYTITTAEGELEVTAVTDEVVVTITGHNSTVTYNGSEQSVNGYDVSIAPEGVSYTTADFSFNGTAEAKGTDAGTYQMGLKADQFANTNGNFKKVTFVVNDGKLTINPVDEVVVTITGHNDTVPYDGDEHTVTGYDVSISNDLYKEGDFTFSGTAEAKGTDAGTCPMGLKAEQFSNNNENFKKVTFVVEDGSLTINKRNVVLTSETASKTYDGTALTKPIVKVTGDGFVAGEVSDIKATGSVTHVSAGEVTNTITYTEGTNFKESNYNITKTEGKLSITPLGGVVVTIKGQTKTVTYDGEEHTAWKYDVIDISDPLYIKAPDEVPNFWNKNAKGARGTDAGTYAMGWEAADFENTNTNFSNVEFVVVDGKLEISKRSVKLTSASDKKVYDGNALTKKEVTVGGDGFAKDEGATYNVTGTQTNVGESKNTFSYTLNEGTKADNYTIEKTEGTLKVTPVTDKVTVTITGLNKTVTYDGEEHSVFGYDATPSNKLYNPKEDMQFEGFDEDMTAKGTDAGTHTMGLTADQFHNKDNGNFTNVTFVVEKDGYVKINPRPVTLTSGSAERVYNGKPLMNETVTVGGDGFAKDEGVTYDFTGSQTDVGESENTFTFEANEGTSAKNYSFEFKFGTLKVTPFTDKVTVTITEKSGTVTYDGGDHIVSGYKSMTANNPLYDVEDYVDETPTEAWTAKGTDAGEYPVGIAADDFKNINTNFENVEFVVVDGALEITPAPVTLQAPIASKTYDGEPLKAEDYVHSYVEGVNFADDFAAVILTGSQTLVGSSSSLITEVIPKEGKKLKNYKFTFLPGTLTVTDGTGDDPVKPENVVTKTHTPKDTGYNVGETVTFTISVKNIYNTPKTITLTEKENVKFSNGESVIVFNDVPAGETVTAEATYTITSADILEGVFHNTVTADFTGGGSWTAEDTVTTAELDTTLNVTKTSDVPDGQKAALGQTITYTIKVQNAGNVPYTNVKVEDPLTKLTATIETLPVGETRTFTTEYVVTEADVLEGHVLNTATATGDKIKDPKSDEPKEPNGGDEVEIKTFAPITIKPKDVTATYNGAAITGKDVEITSGKLLEGHKLSAAVIGSGVNAGSYELTLDPEKITIVDANNKDVSEMYARTILPGKLIINKRSVLITSQSATKTYDGSALTRPAVTITGDGFVPGELAKAEATGSITKVGSTPNAIRYTTTGAFNAANYSIALSVGTLTVTEKPKPEPRRTFNLTISYVYQNGKRAAASYNRGGLKNGETFDITSPVIAGYTASETVVSGTIYNRDIKVTVIYTADGVNLDDYGVPLGLGNITMNVGDCFE